jgi:hypothetical protein
MKLESIAMHGGNGLYPSNGLVVYMLVLFNLALKILKHVGVLAIAFVGKLVLKLFQPVGVIAGLAHRIPPGEK